MRLLIAPCAVLVVLVLTFGSVVCAEAQGRKYAGRPVAEVLLELQTAELRLIFSSDLVPPVLRVKKEPRSDNPRDAAVEILAEHGLALQSGPRGTLLVVQAPRSPGPARRQAPAPEKPSGGQTEPPTSQVPDVMRIEERVDVVDRLGALRRVPSVHVVEPARVRETAGAFENVQQVLPLLPGVAATNDDDGRFSVRGAGPEHNLLVVDGVQIHNPQRLGEFTSSLLNPATAESVTLDASGLDAQHGGRLSSVTTIETRDGRSDRKFAVAGSAGLTNGDVLLEGRLPKTQAGSWWVTARGTHYRMVMDRFGDGVIPGFGDVQAKLTLAPRRRTRLSLFGLVGRERALSQPRLPGEDVAFTETDFGGRNHLGVMNLWWTPNSRLTTATTVSAYSHDERDFEQSFSAAVDSFRRSLSVQDFAARQRTVYSPSSRYVLEAGADLHRIRTSWQMAGVKQPLFWRGLGPSTSGEQIDYSKETLDTRLTRTQAGAWFQNRIRLSETLSLEPGVRVDWNSFTGEATWQPRLRVGGRIGRTVLWTGAAVQAQTPSHEGLQGFDYFHLTDDVGPTLRNERSRQIVAGMQHSLGSGLTLRVEAYRRFFDRLLAQRLETDEERALRLSAYEIPADLPPDSVILERRPTADPESTGRGSASGLELLLERQNARLHGWIAYTLSKATREISGHTVPFDFDRRHALSAAATWQVSTRVRVAGAWRRASGFPFTPMHPEVRFGRRLLPDGTIDPIARPLRRGDGTFMMDVNPFVRRLGLRNTDQLSGYSRTDLRVTYSTLGRWEFYGEVINLFSNRNYILTFTVPPIGGGTTEHVSRNNVYAEYERIPSFGVRVKF